MFFEDVGVLSDSFAWRCVDSFMIRFVACAEGWIY